MGLIDYGNTPTLTKEERLDIARLIVALDNKDDEAIVRAFKRMGFTVSGGSAGEDSPFAKKMMLFSAYGDFDQQYVAFGLGTSDVTVPDEGESGSSQRTANNTSPTHPPTHLRVLLKTWAYAADTEPSSSTPISGFPRTPESWRWRKSFRIR